MEEIAASGSPAFDLSYLDRQKVDEIRLMEEKKKVVREEDDDFFYIPGGAYVPYIRTPDLKNIAKYKRVMFPLYLLFTISTVGILIYEIGFRLWWFVYMNIYDPPFSIFSYFNLSFF